MTHMTIIILYDGNTFQSNDTHQLNINWVKELATSLLPSNTVKLWNHIYFLWHYVVHMSRGYVGPCMCVRGHVIHTTLPIRVNQC